MTIEEFQKKHYPELKKIVYIPGEGVSILGVHRLKTTPSYLLCKRMEREFIFLTAKGRVSGYGNFPATDPAILTDAAEVVKHTPQFQAWLKDDESGSQD